MRRPPHCPSLVAVRDNGKREVRQKTRLMYLIDEWGVARLKEEVCINGTSQRSDGRFYPPCPAYIP